VNLQDARCKIKDNFPDDKLRDSQLNNYHAYEMYLIISKSNNCRSTKL